LGKIGLGSKLFKAAKIPRLTGISKAVMTEVLDAAIWETMRASPGAGAKDIVSSIKRETPFAAGIGFISGVLAKRR
jgi:hypothetical protein